MDLSCMSRAECSMEEMDIQPGDELVMIDLLKLGPVSYDLWHQVQVI